MNSNETFVVIDFETTGLDYRTEQIIELAALKVRGGREIGRLQMLVSLDESRELSDYIMELTGISATDLDGAPDKTHALKVLALFIDDATVVAQNASFDLAFLSPVHVPKSFVCTRTLSLLIEPEENPSLMDVCSKYGIEVNENHRALDHVLATYEVFKIRLRQAEEKGIEFHNVLIGTVDRPLRFIPEFTKVVRGEISQ